MKIFVISLDNEIGKRRRDRLNYDYIFFKAPMQPIPFITKKMNHYWNTGEKKRRGKEGCLSSYYLLFKKIYEEKINDCIILEDDCFMKNMKFKSDRMCYLNGKFINSKDWKCYNNFNKRQGLNEIDYEKSRIVGSLGIYVNNYEEVKPIIDYIDNNKTLKAIDIMLMKKQFIRHYYYPSATYNDDKGISQIGNKSGGIIDNYLLRKS